jgi:hypothetical protein
MVCQIFLFYWANYPRKMPFGGHSSPVEFVSILFHEFFFIHRVTSFESFPETSGQSVHVHFGTPIANHHDLGKKGVWGRKTPWICVVSMLLLRRNEWARKHVVSHTNDENRTIFTGSYRVWRRKEKCARENQKNVFNHIAKTTFHFRSWPNLGRFVILMRLSNFQVWYWWLVRTLRGQESGFER